MPQETVIIADDHPLFRAALRQAVAQRLPDAQIIEAEDLGSLQDRLVENADADLLLLDLHMPGANGFSGLAFISNKYPGLPVIMISAHEDKAIVRKAMDYGASGFIPKSASIDTIGSAICNVLDGDTWLPDGINAGAAEAIDTDSQELTRRVADLTPQQFKVLRMVADGMLNKQIAYDLDVSEATVKAHLTAIMRKLGVRTRTQAAMALNKLNVEPQLDKDPSD